MHPKFCSSCSRTCIRVHITLHSRTTKEDAMENNTRQQHQHQNQDDDGGGGNHHLTTRNHKNKMKERRKRKKNASLDGHSGYGGGAHQPCLGRGLRMVPAAQHGRDKELDNPGAVDKGRRAGSAPRNRHDSRRSEYGSWRARHSSRAGRGEAKRSGGARANRSSPPVRGLGRSARRPRRRVGRQRKPKARSRKFGARLRTPAARPRRPKGTRGPWLKRPGCGPGRATAGGESGGGKISIAKGYPLYLRGDRCRLEGTLTSAGVWHGCWFF